MGDMGDTFSGQHPHIHHLMAKYLTNTCTRAEMLEMLDLLKRADSDRAVKQILSSYWESFIEDREGNPPSGSGQVRGRNSSSDADELFKKILTEARQREVSGNNVSQDRVRSGLQHQSPLLLDEEGAREIPSLRVLSRQAPTQHSAPGPSRQQMVTHKSMSKASRKPHLWIRVAVLLLVACTASLLYSSHVATQEVTETIEYEQKETGSGEKMRFTLPDGTQVHLNAESRLEYTRQFAGGTRDVHLSGEAYFDVAHDAERPFRVHTDELTTRVLGTSFNVRSYPEDEQVVIAVASGSVAVSDVERADGGWGEGSAELSGKEPIVLREGQWLGYTVASQRFETGAGDLSEYVAWNDGILLHHNKKLSYVATQLERWYGVEISFESEELKDCMIRGEYRNEILADVLVAIGYAFNIDYRIDGRQVTLSSNGLGCN